MFKNHQALSQGAPTPEGTLNADQLAAKNAIRNWFFSRTDEQFMTLSGPGGTGKSFTLTHVVNDLAERHKFHQEMQQARDTVPDWYTYTPFLIEITATQNDPVSGLKSAGFEHATTIYSLLGLQLKEDYTTGETYMVKSKYHDQRVSALRNEHTLVIIDESSHVGEMLYKILKSNHIRCLFVGDSAQLRCVGGEHFSVFDPSLGIRSAELTINERATSDSLKEANALLRNAVREQKLAPLIHNGDTIHILSDAEFLYQYKQHVINHAHEPNAVKLLTFRNSSSQDYNLYARRALNRPTRPESGDIILANTHYRGNKMCDVDIRPSQRLKVQSTVVTDACVAALRAKYDFLSGLTGMHVCKLDTNYQSVNGSFSVATYESPEVREYEIAKAQNTGVTKGKWTNYFQAKSHILDYRFSYSESTHKSQGRSYDYVFIDLPDIWDAQNHDTILRLIYVAFSRARIAVFIRNLRR